MPPESAPLVVPLDTTGTAWVTIGPLSEARGWGICHSTRFGVSILRPTLFVRFGLGAPSPRPPVVVRELWSSDPHGLGARALRDLPLALVEACVNQPLHYEAARERSAPAGSPTTPFPWPNGNPPRWWFAHPEPVEAPDPRLEVPPGRPKPDSFYQEVAVRFAHLATTTPRPANVMAEANGVPVTQVHGWVKEARRRGFLPAGERSRRGGEEDRQRPWTVPPAGLRIPRQLRPGSIVHETISEEPAAQAETRQVVDLRSTREPQPALDRG